MRDNIIMKTVPKSLRNFFWDVAVEKLNINKKKDFVISRLLNKGDIKAAKWVEKIYRKEKIKKVLQKSRDFSLINGSFWALIYGLPLSQVKCFQEPYRSLRKKLWPY